MSSPSFSSGVFDPSGADFYACDLQSCPLNKGFINSKDKGNKFEDFGYCPLNRGCPLNTDFIVR